MDDSSPRNHRSLTQWFLSRRPRLPSPDTILSRLRPTPPAERRVQWRTKQHKLLIPQLTLRQSSVDYQVPISPPSSVPQSRLPSLTSCVVDVVSEEENDVQPIVAQVMSDRSPTGRFPPLRKLRVNSSKPSTSSTSVSVDSGGAWKSIDSYLWRSSDGLEVTLRGTHIQYLSLLERAILQKIALHNMQKYNLGCSVSKPKENVGLKQRRHKYVKRKAHTVSVVDKKQGQLQMVFGIPLVECIENDITRDASRAQSLDSQDNTDKLTIHPHHKLSTESSRSSISQWSSDGLSRDSSRDYSSNDNLVIPKTVSVPSSPNHLSKADVRFDTEDPYEPHTSRIPRVVETCTDYLKKHGISTIGLFRVAGSAKRCRQMRVSLDNGQQITVEDEEPEHQPHDIATILKEYFRDLPDPLCSAELYAAFLASAKLDGNARIDVLRNLLAIMPISNCDTLFVLLKFLQDVTRHANDVINDKGVALAGNKMNARNLATIFAPSLLRPGAKETLPTLADNEGVINVMETMINHCDDLFMISRDTQQRIYRPLVETNPIGLDHVMHRLRNQDNVASGESQECTVFYSSQDEVFPKQVTKDADGCTCIKTKSTTTHRIVYKVHKASDSVVEAECLNRLPDNINDLNLFIDDDDDQSPQETPAPLLNPAAAASTRPTLPSTLARLIWSKSNAKDPG